MMDSTLPDLVRLHKALGHPARLRILAMLEKGELCVCQITAVLGLAPSTVSAHLKELRNAGLTEERKEGKWVNVGLARSERTNTVLGPVLDRLRADPQVAADDRMVAELRGIPVEVLCRSGLETARRRIAIEVRDGTDP